MLLKYILTTMRYIFHDKVVIPAKKSISNDSNNCRQQTSATKESSLLMGKLKLRIVSSMAAARLTDRQTGRQKVA